MIMLCIMTASAFGGCRHDTKETDLKKDSAAVKTEITTEAIKITAEDIAERKAGSIVTADELKEISNMDALFYSEEIPDSVFARMDGVSFGEGCIVSREDLRYVRVLHIGFDEKTHIGELVCNQALADDFVSVFKELYEESYLIEKMLLVDEYDGDDEKSMEDNNTSCFNFRPVPGSDHLSQHAYGRAIDVNPLYNPYITADGYTPVNAGAYTDRSENTPHKIDEGDLCYQVFTEHGFFWGGNWNSVKDYQHFQMKN